ncbi:pilus assembly protein PilP [Porticoccaceae bacterium]|nr:pilus assembly protein PilP [Porticoccaceae bacterium]
MSDRLTIITIFCMSFIGGCSSDRQHSDLDIQMSDARNKPRGIIEPLPTYPSAELFHYTSLALRSPFEPPVIVIGDEKVSGSAVPAPNQSRGKEPLELFSYASLSMVGTLAKDSRIWALVDDGEGRVHRVQAGNYLGRNFGIITHIDTHDIEIMETVPDGKGGWINRPRTMAMEESVTRKEKEK